MDDASSIPEHDDQIYTDRNDRAHLHDVSRSAVDDAMKVQPRSPTDPDDFGLKFMDS